MRGFKLPSHRQFDYQPVFYDERKEKLENKIKRNKEIQEEVDSKDYQPNVKGRIKEYYSKSPRRKQVKASNIRLVIFIIALSGAAYYFLNNEILSMLGM